MQATENQALLSYEPSGKCCYSNTRAIRHSSWGSHTVPTMEPLICFPYLTRLVSNSWHVSDGVIPTKMEGQSHMTMKYFMVMSFCCTALWYRKNDKPAYDLILGPCPWRSWNCFIFLNQKSNDEKLMKIILPVMIIIKSASICETNTQDIRYQAQS